MEAYFTSAEISQNNFRKEKRDTANWSAVFCPDFLGSDITKGELDANKLSVCLGCAIGSTLGTIPKSHFLYQSINCFLSFFGRGVCGYKTLNERPSEMAPKMFCVNDFEELPRHSCKSLNKGSGMERGKQLK